MVKPIGPREPLNNYARAHDLTLMGPGGAWRVTGLTIYPAAYARFSFLPTHRQAKARWSFASSTVGN